MLPETPSPAGGRTSPTVKWRVYWYHSGLGGDYGGGDGADGNQQGADPFPFFPFPGAAL